MSDDIDTASTFEAPPGYVLLDWRRGFSRHIGPLYQGAGAAAHTMAFRVEEHHTNARLNAHGGMLMTFADMSWGHIVAVETSSYWATVRLLCDFLSSAHVGDWVEGAGEVLSRENGLYQVRGRVWCGERELLTGTGVFKPLQRRDPRPGEKAYTAPAAPQ